MASLSAPAIGSSLDVDAILRALTTVERGPLAAIRDEVGRLIGALREAWATMPRSARPGAPADGAAR